MALNCDTRWFQNRLADQRLSQRRLAAMLNLDPAAVSLMIRGKRRMSAAEAAEIARFLGVSVEEVLVRAGVSPTIPDRVAKVEPSATVTPGREKEIRPNVAVEDVLELPVPLSDGSVAKLILPRALARADAERIAALVTAFAVGG